jgi:predicted porin
MIRGFMKTTSRTALLAAAGVLMGGYAFGSVEAADLGGNCCGDLEERVAELEATTARKGNRVVSLQVYGQVNKALLWWDDGSFSDTFVVDNDYSGSRIGLTGKANLFPGWTAGYLLEWDYQDSASDKVDNRGVKVSTTGLDSDELNPNEMTIRYNEWFVESETYGRLSLGQGSTAADGIAEIVLANSLRNADLNWVNNFLPRSRGGVLAGFNWAQTAGDLDGDRDDRIRWDSPSIQGFILSSSFADNDYWDVTLRYKNEWNSIRVAAGVGYRYDSTRDVSVGTYAGPPPASGVTTTGGNPVSGGNTSSYLDAFSPFEVVSGSGSIMHIPTGLYLAVSAGTKNYRDFDNDPTTWYVQAGIEKKWLPFGSTTFYGEYAQYFDFNRLGVTYNDATLNLHSEGTDVDSKATRWGVGLVQRVDPAAMDIFAQATVWSYDDNTDFSYDDLTQVMVGSRIKF